MQLTKNIKRQIRELPGLLYQKELNAELTKLDAHFGQWRQGSLSPFDLVEHIHEFHQKPARELYSRFSFLNLAQKQTMKSTIFLLFLILLLTNCSQDNKPADTQTTDGYELVWSDEFEQPGLPDSTKWNYDAGGHGWGNRELQFYTHRRRENARVEGGKLIIEARKEQWDTSNYTSAKLVSRGNQSWLYGKFEVSAKLPKGRGTWPAVWMMPEKDTHGGWPASGEIDIMEHVGFNPGVVHGSVHTEAYNHVIGTNKSDTLVVPGAMDAFHVYAVEWSADSLFFLIDGERYHSFANEHKTYKEWPYDHPFYLILNIAVGGNWGGQKGIDDSIWPQKMEVDYVRVYQKK